MRVAVVADIHGNFDALLAVAEDIKDASPDLIVNLGDCFSGPLEAERSADFLIAAGWPTVRGNHDRALIDRPREKMGDWEAPAYDRMAPAHFDWIRALPETLAIEGLFLCHGTPRSDMTYLMEEVLAGRMVLRDSKLVESDLAGIDANVILCGHSHTPRHMRLLDGRLVVNPGSVGSQAYSDPSETPHLMEQGSPHARYALLDRSKGRWSVTQRFVDYDWERASRLAKEAGDEEWAIALATGRMR
ncbi:phosphodiesterase [Hartmannibacter diazotrophicus]|uniref:Phosphodiesterase n=1 Tax=Hartmannibacter diazotrophicus TaxID=1482074 RepID=A0A2C9D7K1_9HYPH|nr:metallophosphoesterase family protein [Hartmannibacter diazotrophicus]SON56118.1 phosphodiesterase [Hartmannibacter diazotrophicus]